MNKQTGTPRIKKGFAEMFKGGVIIEVLTRYDDQYDDQILMAQLDRLMATFSLELTRDTRLHHLLLSG